jgi:hypothetical protein
VQGAEEGRPSSTSTWPRWASGALEPHPEEISDVNYDTDALNTLMKGYRGGGEGPGVRGRHHRSH